MRGRQKKEEGKRCIKDKDEIMRQVSMAIKAQMGFMCYLVLFHEEGVKVDIHSDRNRKKSVKERLNAE